MTQEEKLLLIKDLCARLPYRVKCYVPVENCTMELTGKRLNYFCFHKDAWGGDYSHEREIVLDPLNDVSNDYIVKPYLRPLSSMTEEERKEFIDATDGELRYSEVFDVIKPMRESEDYCASFVSYLKSIDWLNAHHFDYRGLIEKGLAIEVTEYNNPYKE